MRIPYVLFFGLLIILACQPAQEEAAPSQNEQAAFVLGNDLSIHWDLQTQDAEKSELFIPLTTISIIINKQKFTLDDDAQGEYYQLDSEEMKSWDIPESALSAILGGYGGLYRCIYVQAQKDSLCIYQAWSDAEADVQGWMDLETIKKMARDEFKP